MGWDETCLGGRRLVFACSRRPLWRVPHVWGGGGGRWKSQNRKIVPLSPCVEEPLNSKVIKSFVPEQRSRYVFFKFRDSYVLSLWTFDVRFTHSRIWLWYTCFAVYFINLILILFYKRVVYYYTRILLVLLLHFVRVSYQVGSVQTFAISHTRWERINFYHRPWNTRGKNV